MANKKPSEPKVIDLGEAFSKDEVEFREAMRKLREGRGSSSGSTSTGRKKTSSGRRTTRSRRRTTGSRKKK